jgi:hypothetical protein
MTTQADPESIPSPLEGTPSDEVQPVLDTGRCVVTNLYVSMCKRHPEGRDADYLHWHTFDHRPEQYRISSIRGSLRLVSTPECRSARAASEARYDEVDHVMTYLFGDLAGLKEFNDLAVALRGAGRIPYLLPSVERGVYNLEGTAAAPRIKAGGDVLAWWPFSSAYLLIEEGQAPPSDLVETRGVAGAWWATSATLDPGVDTADGRPLSTSNGLQITYCFLDDDPVATAPRMSEALQRRWAQSGTVPLLAAPFYTVLGPVYDLHLP